MKNQILAQRNKVVHGYRTFLYRFNFKDHNRTEVFTNNVFVDEESGELIIENHLINSLIEQGFEYEMTEGKFRSRVLDENADKHHLEISTNRQVMPEELETAQII